ncbi:VanZ family protein [Mucilaginibacter terrae]|uniref:VanZ family protein n=1 Tax=Mucilaginibacter terrae TaxID=1955052 RepID=A0ABU3GTX9_9SPHI|nr:VanZ family protein [Mucilaginibacter terrae]MDT3402906.1 VanZ family protein [Mucilaginibacter terrae]
MRSFLRYQKLTLGWALFVLVICNMPMGEVGKSPRFFAGFDKLVHCGLFFVFNILSTYGIIRQQRNLRWLNAVKVLVITIAFGAVIELLQLYVFTWRSGDWNDLFADSVGAGMATFGSILTVTLISDEKN